MEDEAAAAAAEAAAEAAAGVTNLEVLLDWFDGERREQALVLYTLLEEVEVEVQPVAPSSPSSSAAGVPDSPDRDGGASPRGSDHGSDLGPDGRRMSESGDGGDGGRNDGDSAASGSQSGPMSGLESGDDGGSDPESDVAAAAAPRRRAMVPAAAPQFKTVARHGVHMSLDGLPEDLREVRSMYFLRNTKSPVSEPTSLAAANYTLDAAFDFGVLKGEPLERLEALLRAVYSPLLEGPIIAQEKAMRGGVAGVAFSRDADFVANMRRFVEHVAHTVQQVRGDFSIAIPDVTIDSVENAVANTPLVFKLEAAARSWIAQVCFCCCVVCVCVCVWVGKGCLPLLADLC